MYWYILVYTSLYKYIQVHTTIYLTTILQFSVYTSMYVYRPFQTDLKKVQTCLEPAMFWMLFAESTPSVQVSDLNAGLKAMKESMNIYIVTVNRWRLSSSAPTPGHDIARQNLDLDSQKSQTCILACLRCCNVPVDESPIQIEAATWKLTGFSTLDTNKECHSASTAESLADGSRAVSTCHDCHSHQHKSTDSASY